MRGTIPKDIKLYNAIDIDDKNVAIKRIKEKCIDCGLCKTICKEREGIEDICKGKACVYCGQCIQSCPVDALVPKNDLFKLKLALENKKICIAYTAPAVRVALGEAFGMPKGAFVQGKLVSVLRQLGFQYVLDVSSGADITIVEEAAELVTRIKNGGVLPMFTSCCPSWVKYTENFYPEILPNLSSCKSPISMQGAVVKEFFCQKYNVNYDNVFSVAITPCTSKKYEITREELPGTDAVITTQELIELIKKEEIEFKNIEDSNYDDLFGEGSGAGLIFGNTGGVMEAAIRSVYKIMTGENLTKNQIEFHSVRGLSNVKEAVIDINGFNLNVAVVNQMSCAKTILEDVKKGKSKYHFIEIMNCLGGCVGGGGQPKSGNGNEGSVKRKRMESLYNKDSELTIRFSHQNPSVVKLYDELLGEPLSEKAKSLLHTNYKDSSQELK